MRIRFGNTRLWGLLGFLVLIMNDVDKSRLARISLKAPL